MQEAVQKKITKKQADINRKESEINAAKDMTYDQIIDKIAHAKKQRDQIQSDINTLVDNRGIEEATISRLNRIMAQKKKLAGA